MNAAGGGALAFAPFTVNPNPPSGVVATAVSGNTVTLDWRRRRRSRPAALRDRGRRRPGPDAGRHSHGSAATGFTFTAPTGTFFVRVRTDYFRCAAAASNEVQIFVNVPAPPSRPSQSARTGQRLGAGAVVDQHLRRRRAHRPAAHVTGTINGVLPLGLAETFAFPGVPPGIYTLRVIATNASGASPPSSPITLTFPGACTGVPGVPSRIVATKGGDTIRVTWAPPETERR